MKKILTYLTGLVLVLGLSVGCKKENAPGGHTQVNGSESANGSVVAQDKIAVEKQQKVVGEAEKKSDRCSNGSH